VEHRHHKRTFLVVFAARPIMGSFRVEAQPER
jgi:hypothetical protein